MIKDIYSYRLNRVVTLLSNEEFAPIGDALSHRLEQIKAYRKVHQSSIGEARRKTSMDALDLYESLTGIRLEHPDELYAVLQEQYGSLCPECSKPFRTPKATFCAECGCKLPDGEVAGPLCD
jgi:rRNA maturation endonuclease Nob1